MNDLRVIKVGCRTRLQTHPLLEYYQLLVKVHDTEIYRLFVMLDCYQHRFPWKNGRILVGNEISY